MKLPETIVWTGKSIRLLDQTLLPGAVKYRECATLEEAAEAIRSLRVRGAPAIGVMAAYTLALAIRRDNPQSAAAFFDSMRRNVEAIDATRPTAHNLAWALRQCAAVAKRTGSDDPGTLSRAVIDEADRIAAEDRELCRRIGAAGSPLVPDGAGVLTHCNAGALATAGMGTALAPLYMAWEEGRRFHVYADETRPLWQGARLTAWELSQSGIPVSVLCDGAAASLIASGRIDLVIVGADRITASGDVANKIGTYGVALAAERHDVPFYVAAPRSTFDLSLSDGSSIPIEQRPPGEVTAPLGTPLAPAGVEGWNPAFDVTPASLVTRFITDAGVIAPPFYETIGTLFGGEATGGGEREGGNRPG